MDKKLLAVAVGAIASSSALATPVLVDTTSVYATESLVAATPTVAGADVDITDIGVGVTTNNQLFVRVDISGGVKFGAVPPAIVVAGASSNVVAQGGANSAFVIFSSTAGAGNIAQDSDANITMGTLTVPGTNTASAVTVCTYETLSGAVNQTGSLGCDTNNGYLSMVSGIDVTADAPTLTASVDEDYKLFLGPVATGALGTHGVAAAANVLNAGNGAAVALTDVIDEANSVVTYAGDFSVGNFFVAPSNACAASIFDVVEKVNNVVQASDSANLNVVNGGTLCVTEPGTTAIPVANYTVAIDFAGVATHVAPTDVPATAFGSIVRDGTQIEVDYLSTFSGYNQRIVMTNRGNRDYTYETSFTTEDGVTATPGAAATGTLPAGEVTVVKVSDMVTFTGGTRGSGVITIPATAGTVDAATTQVNLSDGGTDTVYLD